VQSAAIIGRLQKVNVVVVVVSPLVHCLCPRTNDRYPSEWVPGNYESFRSRISQFEEWLQTQPEETVAVVGHSQYFKAMLGLDFKFGNCDVWQVQFDGNSSNSSSSPALENKNDVEIDGATYTLPKPWSQLKKLYTCGVPPIATETNGKE
jgi:hypothetical protein